MVFVGISFWLVIPFVMVLEGIGIIAAVAFFLGIGPVYYSVRRDRNKQSMMGN